MRRTVLATTIALAAVAPAAGAAIPQRYFAVSIKGVQTTMSSYKHVSTGPCDPSDSNTSSERVVFHSTHSRVILATYFDRLKLVSFGKGQPKERELPTTFSITHRNRSVHGTIAPNCVGSGGDGTAPKMDCGTRTRKLSTEFSWLHPIGIQLEVPDYSSYGQPFQNCPVGGAIFPQLLDIGDHGKRVFAPIPAAELFDPGWREHIIVASGTESWHDATGGSITKIRWEVTLRAVPPPGKPHARVY